MTATTVYLPLSKTRGLEEDLVFDPAQSHYYYVTVINGKQKGYLAGPFNALRSAGNRVAVAKQLAELSDPWGVHYAYGTAGVNREVMPKGISIGVVFPFLNQLKHFYELPADSAEWQHITTCNIKQKWSHKPTATPSPTWKVCLQKHDGQEFPIMLFKTLVAAELFQMWICNLFTHITMETYK